MAPISLAVSNEENVRLFWWDRWDLLVFQFKVLKLICLIFKHIMVDVTEEDFLADVLLKENISSSYLPDSIHHGA